MYIMYDLIIKTNFEDLCFTMTQKRIKDYLILHIHRHAARDLQIGLSISGRFLSARDTDKLNKKWCLYSL